jgi:glycosyltransferase involved in cell wall biosynthesis
MLRDKKITVVIPTLNEAKGIRSTIELVPKFVDEIVVVDADSTDETRAIAASCGARVILEKRRGYGRAFKTGFAAAKGDLIATADGDGTYPIELLEEIAGYLLDQDLDFVSCSRFPRADRESMKPVNYVGNKLMTLAASVLWLHPFRDILSGMWVFRRDCLPRLALHSNTWNLSEEIKLQAYEKLGRRFAEYNIPYRERIGETKLMPWKVGAENLGYMLAMRTRSVELLRGFLKKNADQK